jgi:adenosylhomocysteine nucleosidase
MPDSVGSMDRPSEQGAGRTAFVCAMPMELAPLKRTLGLQRKVLGPIEVFEGSVGGRPAVAVVTGIGTARAERHVTRLLDAVTIERVVVVGIAGSIEEDVAIGAPVVPDVVVDGASGTEYRPERLGSGEPRGKLWTSDALITDDEVIAGLRGDGVVALDMETAAVAAVCARRRTPWSVFRSVSDRTSDGLVGEEVLGLSRPDGTPDTKSVVAHLAKHPTSIRALSRMAGDARLACRVAAERAIEAVSLSPPGS